MSRGRFLEYIIEQTGDVWKMHTEHEFLTRLADGSLPIENFKYYLIQDYLFLVGKMIMVETNADLDDRFNLRAPKP